MLGHQVTLYVSLQYKGTKAHCTDIHGDLASLRSQRQTSHIASTLTLHPMEMLARKKFKCLDNISIGYAIHGATYCPKFS